MVPLWCCLYFIGSRRVFGMVSDGLQAQKRSSWILGKERAERVLANAISIDGRKEWMCKFCSESNVWTRWRCRRCCHNILATLYGKYRQAVAATSGEWYAWKLRIRSSEQGLMPWKRKEGVQKGRGISFNEEGDSGGVWGRLHGSRGRGRVSQKIG